jgi:hypothetical protein
VCAEGGKEGEKKGGKQGKIKRMRKGKRERIISNMKYQSQCDRGVNNMKVDKSKCNSKSKSTSRDEFIT